MFVKLTNSKQNLDKLVELSKKVVYLNSNGFRINRRTLEQLAQLVSVSIVGNSVSNNKCCIRKEVAFSLTPATNSRGPVVKKKTVQQRVEKFTICATGDRAEREKYLKEKQQRKEERIRVKQEKMELQERADRNGLLGINPEAEDKIPHMIPELEEKVQVERRTINKWNIFYLVLIYLINVTIVLRWNWTLIYSVPVSTLYSLITLITTLIARRRSIRFQANFERLTGWSVEKLQNAKEARVDVKILKQMKVLCDDQEDLVSGTFVQEWSVLSFEYNLLNVLKNNVRSKYVESFITQETLRQVKAERKERYDSEIANRNRSYIRVLVSFVWNSFTFILDHKALVAAIVFAGTVTSFFGVIKTAITLTNSVSYTLDVTSKAASIGAEAMRSVTNKTAETIKSASNVVGRGIGIAKSLFSYIN